MVRHSAKHKSARLVLICVGLLGLALIADFLWASSPRFANSYISNWAPPLDISKPNLILTPKKTDDEVHGKGDRKNGTATGRVLSATFADLPGPELKWEKMAAAPVARLDGAAVQIKNLLFVFAGYCTIDYIILFTTKKKKKRKITNCFMTGDINELGLNSTAGDRSDPTAYAELCDNTWGGRFDMPKEMAHSHLVMVTDGRYIYIITGQYGPQCRGPTAHTFVLETETKQWRDMPPLPVPRFAPATQLWRGRLHVMGGSKENRYTPGVDHWSLAVKDGKALEKEWRTEMPIPRGGPLRACIVVDDYLYLIGGQEGDFMAKPGSPIFKCSRRNEVVYGDVYMLDDEMKWKVLPPMPKPDSHIEFAWVVVNNSVVIVGGTTEKHPVTKKMTLVGEIFQFNLNTLNWSVLGKLPFRVKTTLVGFWNGWLYFTSGSETKDQIIQHQRRSLESCGERS